MGARTAYRKLVREAEGPLAKVRVCRLCGFVVTLPKHPFGGGGRGYGMREGNKARGVMIQHLKLRHRQNYEEAKQ